MVKAKSIFLVVATSGRAIAQGLTTLGYPCAVIDGFDDQDTIAAANVCKKVKRSRYGLDENEVLHAVNTLQSEFSIDGLLYDAAFEANPSLLEKIGIEPVYGNSFRVVNACKTPSEFFSTLDCHSIPYPEINFKPIHSKDGEWLCKSSQSSGGIGVKSYQDGDELPVNGYLQKRITGTNFSLTFFANETEIFSLGFNTLWCEELNEDMPYIYAGAINKVKLDKEILTTAEKYAETIAREFKLIGLNSIDFICADDAVYVLEVNPRIPATYELYETKYGEVMKDHIEVCKTKNLPAENKVHLLRAHAIVYALQDVQIPENMSWPLWTADRPHAGETIAQFEPICSVFSGGKNTTQVREMIKTRKQSIINKLV